MHPTKQTNMQYKFCFNDTILQVLEINYLKKVANYISLFIMTLAKVMRYITCYFCNTPQMHLNNSKPPTPTPCIKYMQNKRKTLDLELLTVQLLA